MGFILIILLNCTKMGFDKIKFGGRVKIEEKLLMHKCKRVVIWGREMFKKFEHAHSISFTSNLTWQETRYEILVRTDYT